MNRRPMIAMLAFLLILGQASSTVSAQEMDALWGERVVKLRVENSKRGQLLDEGNYAMFIHWGLYSQLANKVDDVTYYGIGEWIMNRRMAGIPIDRYKQLARTFNPTRFDAPAIAKLAKDAGMKYIVITSKHHDGFAMYDSKACDFNIVDATPWKKDPMQALAAACRAEGLGFGFYYSHNQDWTFPGGGNGPTTDAQGDDATFDDYFRKKCLPQVREITSQYGPIEIVWFDTPGKMPKNYVEQLVAVVRQNQPHALVSGRAGYDLGDYQTLGDMEVPHHNIDGIWESVDTTNDSWAYAWYDENWKSPRQILRRLIACVGRGGTYMLNIGPRGDGSVPERPARSLREAGRWIHRYPQVVYAAGPSPWKHALPWGDATTKGNQLMLAVFEWPESGKLFLPGLKTQITSARLLGTDGAQPLTHHAERDWVILQIPPQSPDPLAAVIELQLQRPAEADSTWGIDPVLGATLLAEFSTVQNAQQSQKRWMEKFGEWKSTIHVHDWKPGGQATWTVNVMRPGDYLVHLTYAGEGRLVWQVEIAGGQSIRNQQNSSHNYQEFPIGWIHFPRPGKYSVAVSCLDGNLDAASLKSIRFEAIR